MKNIRNFVDPPDFDPFLIHRGSSAGLETVRLRGHTLAHSSKGSGCRPLCEPSTARSDDTAPAETSWHRYRRRGRMLKSFRLPSHKFFQQRDSPFTFHAAEIKGCPLLAFVWQPGFAETGNQQNEPPTFRHLGFQIAAQFTEQTFNFFAAYLEVLFSHGAVAQASQFARPEKYSGPARCTAADWFPDAVLPSMRPATAAVVQSWRGRSVLAARHRDTITLVTFDVEMDNGAVRTRQADPPRFGVHALHVE